MNQNLTEKLSLKDKGQDEELARQAALGNQAAFTNLYERNLPSVYKRVAYLIPKDDVDDITQEVFIAMMRSLKTFRGEAKFTTWLRVIANRQIANYYRKNKKAMQDSDLDLDDSWLQSRISMKQDHRKGHENKILVQQSLMNISEKYREIIILRFVEGLKFKEIADYQGKTLDATKSMFRRAIEAMRNDLGAPDA